MTKTEQTLLVLMVPEQVKDNVVDSLMANGLLSGFSLLKIQGFSAQNSHFNLKEQVEGYKDLYRFEVLHDSEHTQALIDEIKIGVNEGNFRYWLTPVLQAGYV